MSRIGKQPIPVPSGVDIRIDGLNVSVKGPLGQLQRTFKSVSFERADDNVNVLAGGETRTHRAMWGLSRTLLDNMVVGVSRGFEKKLEIHGVGYRAESKGKQVIFQLGYSHPIDFAVPDGITIGVEKQTQLLVTGVDKELVGETAARIRALRPPEPYKGKGIRYSGEYVRRKAGKTA